MTDAQRMMDHWATQAQLGQETAVVIPVYFSSKPSDATVDTLLRITLMDCHHYLPPNQVWAVVDGDPRSAAFLARVVDDLATDAAGSMRTIVLEENRGKLGAMRVAMATILREQSHVRWLAVMDGDGDHMVAVLPRLTRAALFLAEAYGHDRVLAIGARASRTQPMGWVRGELERLLDGLTIEAMSYALAREGRALDLSQCLGVATPDLSSGYKVYGRGLAELLFDGAEPVYATLSPRDYDRYGPETVTIVEMILAGGVMGEVLRPSWDGQPATSFGEFGVVDMYGELLAWAWARLEVPVAAAAQMYDNWRRQLALSMAPEGAELVRRVRDRALGRLSDYQRVALPPAPRPRLPFT